jgi:hypothetical protein
MTQSAQVTVTVKDNQKNTEHLFDSTVSEIGIRKELIAMYAPKIIIGHYPNFTIKEAKIVGYEYSNGLYVSVKGSHKKVIAQVCFQFMSDDTVNVFLESRSGNMIKTHGKEVITKEHFNELKYCTEYADTLFSIRAFAILGIEV